MNNEYEAYTKYKKEIITKENEVKEIEMQLKPLNERINYLKSIVNKNNVAKLALVLFIFYGLSFYSIINWMNIKTSVLFSCLITTVVLCVYIADSHPYRKVIKEYERKEPNHICENVQEAKMLLKGLEKNSQKLKEEKETKLSAISTLKLIMQEEKDRLFLKNMLKEMQSRCIILEEMNKKQYIDNIETKFNNFANEAICERTIIDDYLNRESYKEIEEPIKLTLKNK